MREREGEKESREQRAERVYTWRHRAWARKSTRTAEWEWEWEWEWERSGERELRKGYVPGKPVLAVSSAKLHVPRVDEHNGTKLRRRLPQRVKVCVVKVAVFDMGANLHAREFQLFDATLELRHGVADVVHGQRACWCNTRGELQEAHRGSRAQGVKQLPYAVGNRSSNRSSNRSTAAVACGWARTEANETARVLLNAGRHVIV